MAILKCKMCGGTLDVSEGMTVCECEYCGTMQTIPSVDDAKKITLFSRANRLRAACEFDKAASVYENIVGDFPEEAEAYWGLVLCKFGIEYVDDPATGKKIPTCHRSSFESIMDDPDFEQTMENADSIARKVYREEAKTIDGIQKGILEISGKEEPYDIFICYKETDDNGDRTVDSVMAQDIYDMLTENKYRVFFARISLEDKLGTAYEPYIFAALNSARIMLAIGTDYEYYNAVWVKNEWSRFLAMMSKDKKKVLIPCYKDIDAYDIPKEFKHLQAQDMGKVGAMQDLLRGIKKILPKDAVPVVQQVTAPVTQIVQGGANVSALLQRIFMFLEDSNWQSADQYCEKVLDVEPQNGEAYLGKLMVELKLCHREELAEQKQPFDEKNNFKKAIRFGSEQLRTELSGYIDNINERNYSSACKLRDTGEENNLWEASRRFEALNGYKDSAEQIEICRNMIRKIQYQAACALRDTGEENNLWEASRRFEALNGYKDSAEQVEICKNMIFEPKYQEACALRDTGEDNNLWEASRRFEALKGYKDSAEQVEICKNMIFEPKYQEACALRDTGEENNLWEASGRFEALKGYKDSAEQIKICKNMILELKYQYACTLQVSGKETNLQEAIGRFSELTGYKDSYDRSKICARAYKEAKAKRQAEEAIESAEAWESVERKRESVEKKSKLYVEQTSLQNELAKLNGLFAGKRRKEIETRLAQIEDELRRLG